MYGKPIIFLQKLYRSYTGYWRSARKGRL